MSSSCVPPLRPLRKTYFIDVIVFSIWDCIEGIKSHLCEVAIPVMLHCVSLPCGSDIFWKLIRDEFHSQDWRIRFDAGKIKIKPFNVLVVLKLN